MIDEKYMSVYISGRRRSCKKISPVIVQARERESVLTRACAGIREVEVEETERTQRNTAKQKHTHSDTQLHASVTGTQTHTHTHTHTDRETNDFSIKLFK